MPRLQLPWRKKVELKFKWKSGEEGSIELDEYPESPAMKIREVLGVDDICDEFEWVRIYVKGRLKYTYPCGKKKKKEEEDELDQLLKQMKMDIFREYLEDLKAKRNISPKDLLAQMVAEFQISKDLYQSLKQIYEPQLQAQTLQQSSSPLDKIMEKVLDTVVTRALSAQAQQSSTQQAPQQAQQANIEALVSMLPEDLKNTIKDVVEKFKQMPPEEQQKLVQEAMKEANKFRA
jgi:membrane-associated HD superfamily phosphohydrolase